MIREDAKAVCEHEYVAWMRENVHLFNEVKKESLLSVPYPDCSYDSLAYIHRRGYNNEINTNTGCKIVRHLQYTGNSRPYLISEDGDTADCSDAKIH